MANCVHLEKGQVVSISRKKNPIRYTYRLHGQALKAVQSVKYLGLTVTHDMKWNNHISNITAAANRTLGFVKINLRVKSAEVKDQAYKVLVRPKLEYCAAVWDHKATSDKFTRSMRNHRLVNQIEMVQRRAARWVTGRHNNTSSVSEMLQSLGWRSLE